MKTTTTILLLLVTSPVFCQLPVSVLQVFEEVKTQSFEKIVSIQYRDKLYFFTEGRYQITCSLSSSKELSFERVRLIASNYDSVLFAQLNENPGDVNVKGIVFRFVEDGKRKKKTIDYVWLFIERYVIHYNF